MTMDFTIKQEMTLGNFKAWSGGKDRLDKIIELDIIDEASEFISEIIGTELGETELNDFLWFEMDDFIEEYEEEDGEDEKETD